MYVCSVCSIIYTTFDTKDIIRWISDYEIHARYIFNMVGVENTVESVIFNQNDMIVKISG